MKNAAAAGSTQALHLVVSDIAAARAELVSRATIVRDSFQLKSCQQLLGLDPHRADYGSFFSFADPDGNGWLVQEVG